MTPKSHVIFLKSLKERSDKLLGTIDQDEWQIITGRLSASPVKIRALLEMDRTGGEPALVLHDKKKDNYHFFDCSVESPAGRRSLCYDLAALNSRKTNKPQDSAMNMASQMGIELLTEEQYRYLQTLGNFDMKTSSWVKTPLQIREKGGAIFGDFRYGQVFIYHNGAESYYAARGFRGCIMV